MPQRKSKHSNGRPAAATITDERFANFQTDPRFSLPSSRKSKVAIDKRFAPLLKDTDFTATAKVDKYGRKLKSDSKKKALQRLYRQEDEDEENDSEDGSDDDDDKPQAGAKYDPARGGGFSNSQSDSDSEDEDEEIEVEVDEVADIERFRDEQAEVPTGEVTKRIAIVNMDWDRVKAVDLFACLSSFIPKGEGRIQRVQIFPSEFGKERMQREEMGPPKELFKKQTAAAEEEEEEEEENDDGGALEDDSTEEDAEDGDFDEEEIKKQLLEEGDDADFDSDALRKYQLDRLRYYYAVVQFSDASTAETVYEATDGREYLSSSNFLDLRFIPDDVTFDDEPHDEADAIPSGYKPIEFTTDALQSSKVQLTWDMHPEEATRKESIKRAFSGSRADIAENDLRAYLASDSDESGPEEEPEAAGAAEEPKLSKKELARRKMREALGLSDDPAPKSSTNGPVGDMQITFTSALSDKPQKDPAEETTVEKYIRKEKERKERRRQKAAGEKDGVDADENQEAEAEAGAEEDLGFDDPFFMTDEPAKLSKSAIRKEERLKKRAERDADEKEKAAEKAQLELLMADNPNDEAPHLEHFDMNEIVRAEKKKYKKGKKGKKGKEERGGLQEDFRMDVADPRFQGVFESHEFAIDPSNPKFKATPGMKNLLEEGRKRRSGFEDHDGVERDAKKSKSSHRSRDMLSLAESIKNKGKKSRAPRM